MKKLTEKEKEKFLKIVNNIKRFEIEKNETNYYTGWNNALDTVVMDIKRLD